MAKQEKQVTVTMTFTTNDVYPSDDIQALQENVFGFLNSNLLAKSLTNNLKLLANEKGFSNDIQNALLEQNKADVSVAEQMVKSIKISVK